jgi:hypothetical protein
MHRLADDVVDAAIEECKGRFERWVIADRDDRRQASGP